MADLRTIIFSLILPTIHCDFVYSKMPEGYGKDNRSHLEFTHVKKLCGSRGEVCKSNDTNVCALRLFNGSLDYRNFENSCFLFLSNMCDHPGEEYNIVEGISCEAYLRRRNERRNNAENATDVNDDNTKDFKSRIFNSTEPAISRTGEVSKLYDIDTAFDDHSCPLSCPDTYSPVCVSANRGAGKHFKFYTFVNHCAGDVYYCKHFEEFAPPPDADEEDVNSSGLSWSYCGAFRYMQFARFSEVLSSMGHYGWLAGRQRYSHIMEPAERRPGFG